MGENTIICSNSKLGRNGALVTSACCSSTGQGFVFHHPSQAAYSSL